MIGENGGDTGLLRALEPGNVVGVRLCARFAGWEISARDGYLFFDVGDDSSEYCHGAWSRGWMVWLMRYSGPRAASAV